MTKNFKLALALILSIMMILSSVSALAEDFEKTTLVEIKLNDNAAHTKFKAVQIFQGVQEATPDNSKLGNIVWGDKLSDTNKTAIINAINEVYELTGENALATTADAITVAKKLGDVATKSGTALAYDAAKENALAKKLGLALADVAGTYLTNDGKNEVPAGYYLIIDETELGETGDAYNASLLQMTHDITINKKTDAPGVEKKIIEATAVDADNKKIGDHVAYEITSEIPDHSHYDHYFFVINDTLSTGLTFDNNVVVYKSEPNTDEATMATKPYNDEVLLSATATAPATPDYYLYTGSDADGKTFQVALANAKALPVGTKIIVRFTATLNENAKVGEVGNPNKATLIYSNKPDDSGDGNEDDEHPGKPDSTKPGITGETPEDIVITYTAQMTILKVDDNNQPLEGAEFTITGTGKTTHLKGIEKFVEATDGTYYKLYNNEYTETAPVAAHMEKAAAGATAGYVIDNDYTKPDMRVYEGVTYRPYVAADDADKDIYVENLGNEADYVSTEKKYKKETATETTQEDFNIKEVLTVSGGTHTIIGLPAGTYTIEETKVPTGFNKVENKTLVIKCEMPTTVTAEGDKATWSVDTGSSDGWAMDTAATANYKITIQNLSGATLPETGGAGTTIFYVAGSIMVLAAAILLITKRRMGAND
jgi:fimbrial isopeptide formation D2 family protein/LPXTG-motif cell wall-anchored protein